MNRVNERIRKKALQRISNVFGLPVTSLNTQMLFEDLPNSKPVSIFRCNEFDIILDDIHDVCDSKTFKKVKAGKICIKTVEDYVNHMILSYAISPELVSDVLGKIEE